jgi:LEA14-like dessication related protein
MKNQKLIIIGVIAALAVGVFLWFRTNTKKLLTMAEFRIKGLKVGKIEGMNIPLDVNIEIFNPSDFAVPVKNYKVEVYKRENNELLSTSNVASLNIPANGTVVNKVTFNISILQVIDAAFSLLNLDWGKIEKDFQRQIASKVMFKIYAEVGNQFIEREINL